MLRSAFVWLFLWVYLTIAAIFCLPWVWITGRLSPVYGVARWGMRALLAMAGVRVAVTGAGHLPREAAGGCIYMANHQSNLDPLVLVTHLPGALSFMAKRELFKVPVLGMVLRAGGLVPVDRGDRAAAQASVGRAAGEVKAGRPVVIFPEGSRSPDGALLEFKKGPFYLAEDTGAPVVAITLTGTGERMRRGSWRLHPGPVTMTIHPVIQPEMWRGSAEPRSVLSHLVRQAISQG